jgi:micrococcal nuclease
MEDSLYFYKAKVLSIYDADTITCEVDLGFKIKVVKKIRLAGINAPELKGNQREQGLLARDYLRSLIDGKTILLKTSKDKGGKYGRLLGTIIFEDRNINDLLVEEGYAVKY